jgi:type VI secretion system protein ImpK
MTPEHAEVVDPIFSYVLDLLERINGDEAVSPDDERLQIRSRLDHAEAKVGQSESWLLTKYALVAWIDEVLVEAPWPGSKWWENNTLEWEQFQSQDRSEKFYLKSKEAAMLRNKDALEVFYIGVVLGFRGLYRDAARTAALTGPLELPPDLDTWFRQTSMAIQLGKGRPPISEGPVAIEGAPPLEGPFALLGYSFLGLVLLALTGLTAVLSGLISI